MDHLINEQLKKLGLQPNEARVYSALLELGRGTVTEISRRAELNRTTGYDILERLGIYGLVNRVITSTRKRLYIPEPLSRLKQFLENQKKQSDRRLENFEQVFPTLQNLFKTDLKPQIKIAEGRTAMEQMYLGVLDAKSPVYAILNLKGYAEAFDQMGVEQTKERVKRGIREKVLALDSTVAREWYAKTYKGKKTRQRNTEYRWLPWDDRYQTAGEINIFDDKVIGLLSKPEENIAFEIQSQTVADFLKIIFEKAWEKTN
jgi:sugar-specific transcriptional regulator TrmB